MGLLSFALFEDTAHDSERFLQMERHLVNPVQRNETRDRNHAPIARRKPGTSPNIAKQYVIRVSRESWR
jgi:hypothetical protein